jgi:RHS repeat-associated protein
LDKFTAITYPSGNRVNYSYDASGFVSAISVTAVNPNGVGLSATTTALIGTVTYNADNNPSGWKWSDAKARTIGYDSVGQVASYTLGDPNGTGNAAGVLRTVSRDPAERITAYTHTNNGSAVTSLDQGFVYDNLNRLLTDTVSPASTSYSYDETGNRASKTIGGTTYTNTVASTSNRLTQTQDVGGTSSVSYDAAGNISGDGTNTYIYNDRGRMTSASTASGTVTFTYNGLNQRASKALGGASTYYVYNEGGQLVGEYDNAGAPVYETIYLGAMPVGALKQTGSAGASNIAVTLYNVDADQIAVPRMITKQDHTIVWRWDTAEAFGGTAPNQDPSGLGAFVFNQRFPGQVFDSETGLFQNWNREYNARLGRYVESDPIGLDGGINTFSYVGASPLNSIDPQGLQWQAAAAAACGPGWFFCGAAAMAATWGMWSSSHPPAPPTTATAAPTTVAELCPNCKATMTRAQAQELAYAAAGIPNGGGPGFTPTRWKPNFNPPEGYGFGSRPWANFKQTYDAPLFGWSGPNGSVEEHPLGHPDMAGGLNHECPHFVAKNARGVVLGEFPYRPGS